MCDDPYKLTSRSLCLSVQPGKAADGKAKVVDPANVAANLRDLTVHLHRGNTAEAKTIAAQAAEQLQEIIQSGDEPGSSYRTRAADHVRDRRGPHHVVAG